ncbi:MAG: nucleotidyl transferase AbiEii/AbiGii toxin family protein [Elusimicrobiota bacterium]
MKDKNYYENSLYPLQNIIFSILNRQGGLFYLTGGTALSRFYFNHRYSDDLDFFSKGEIKEFKRNIAEIVRMLPQGISCEVETISNTFARIIVKRNETYLKVDFVNDVVFRWGEIKEFALFKFVDNEINILANKIDAIERYEVKDIVDIWVIARNRSFVWKDVFEITLKKALIEPINISKVIKIMPEKELGLINWTNKIASAAIYKDLQVIAKNILLGEKNSLFPEIL